MILRKIEIENIRSLSSVKWEVEASRAAGWHVILGDNGSGKSTFLRCVALALVGPTEAAALRQNWREWLRFGQEKGQVELYLDPDARWDKFLGKAPKKENLRAGVRLSDVPGNPFGVTMLDAIRSTPDPNSFLWSGTSGWFCASYGPFRRFTGGDKEVERIYSSNPRLAPHLSVFGENVALTEALEWLKTLKFQSLERADGSQLLGSLTEFINQPDFLPHGARLNEVSSEGVNFVDGNGNKIRVEELSDGYRSILSMTFELIRQLARVYEPDSHQIFDEKDPTKIIAPGVVLIDEIDVHLHPSWQRRVGGWFRSHFPNLQFIVTTHSPLVCQAASEGTIFKLPRPGTQEVGAMVTGIELERLLKGNILEALDTPAFGVTLTRSDESQDELKQLAKLNMRELRGGLSATEKREQDRLRAVHATTAHILSTNGVNGHP